MATTYCGGVPIYKQAKHNNELRICRSTPVVNVTAAAGGNPFNSPFDRRRGQPFNPHDDTVTVGLSGESLSGHLERLKERSLQMRRNVSSQADSRGYGKCFDISRQHDRFHVSAQGMLGGEIDAEKQFWKTRRSRNMKQMVRAMNPNLNEAVVYRKVVTSLARQSRKQAAVDRAMHAGKHGGWVDLHDPQADHEDRRRRDSVSFGTPRTPRRVAAYDPNTSHRLHSSDLTHLDIHEKGTPGGR